MFCGLDASLKFSGGCFELLGRLCNCRACFLASARLSGFDTVVLTPLAIARDEASKEVREEEACSCKRS